MDLLDTLVIASAGLEAFAGKTQIAAYNLANISTDGFRAVKDRFATGSNGTSVRLDILMAAGKPVQLSANHRLNVKDAPSETDMATEIVSLIVGERGFQANAKVVETTDAMLGTLLNMKS